MNHLDQYVWVCDTLSTIVAFGGGKGDAPAPPDYTPIAQADQKSAELQAQLGQEQFDWAKSQFNTVWPYAQQYLTSQTAATDAEQKNAADQQGFYDTTYKPIEAQFANTAGNYATPERTEQRAGAAMADVANTFAANRQAAQQSLESYGIDPSQTRFQALDASSRVSQAAATAAAGTQSRLNTEATGLALQGEAINTGRGYPSAVASAYNTATNSGSSGLNAANQTTATGASTAGTPGSFFAGSTAANAGGTGALNAGFSNAATSAQIKNQLSVNQSQGIGNLIGGGLGLAMTGIPSSSLLGRAFA